MEKEKLNINTNEFQIVREFTKMLGLENQTDGTIFIYKKPNNENKMSLKPDGYYYKDGVTFILDAKAYNKNFSGQLEDYLQLEQNPNNIGFKYNGKIFQCYVNKKLMIDEIRPQSANYYIEKYFKDVKSTLPSVVSNFAKKLAKEFRDAKVDKQNNVPFIGAIMLCLKFCKDFEEEILSDTSKKILQNIKVAINKYVDDIPLNKKQKKEKIKLILDDQSLNDISYSKLLLLISNISTIYNFINVDDQIGHDTMNGFLKIFRKWNSVNAKEKGEVFTPDHIAQLMYELTECNYTHTILDPTCGSGTFLVNAMFNMINEIKKESNYLDLKRKILENQIIGIEDSTFNAMLAGINMMLHDDGSSNIFKDDCFRKLPELFNIYDRVLMNPPFSQEDKELKFVLETLKNMKENGLLAAIVPISSILSYKESKNGKVPENLWYKREILKNHNLKAVIRLPKKLFHPNASVQTAIVIIEAHVPYKGKTWRKNLLDDGYIENRNVGRVEHHYEEAIENFKKENPEFITLTAEEDWPKYDDVDYTTIEKIDFMKQKLDFLRQKLDFMLISDNVEDKIKENEKLLNIDNISVSNSDLNFKNWKSFKLLDLFNIENGKDVSDENNPENKGGSIPLIIASSNHNGVGYYIRESNKIFSKECISLVNQGDGASGIAKAHSYDFAATSSVSVLSNISKKISDLNTNIISINLFVSTVLSKLHDLFDYTYSMSLNRLEKISVLLPAKDDEPDWEYMSKYIENKI